MEEYLRQLTDMLGRIHPVWAYLLLLISALLENLIPPIPGDTVVVFSAYLVGRGVLGFWPVYLVTCAGSMAGFVIMYYLGYTRGRAFFTGRGSRFFPPANLIRAEQWLARYGKYLILGNRFLSGIRSVIAIAAGIGRMDWRPLAGFGALSIVFWNGMLLGAGLIVGQNWETVAVFLKQYNRLLSLGAAGLVLAFLGRWWRRRRAKPT
jgi:membrane protein DedA with SNARE-associated domain